MNPKRKHSDPDREAGWQNEPTPMSPEDLKVLNEWLQSVPVEGAPMGFTPALMRRVRAQRQMKENRFLWVTAAIILAAAGMAGWFCIQVMDKPDVPDFQPGWILPVAVLVVAASLMTWAGYMRGKELGR